MKINKKKYFLIYTLSFILLFFLCFAYWFMKYNKSFFRSYDGIDQHYLIFIYIGRWLREIIHNIFVKHEFVIPMWDMSIGYGADIMTTLGAYLPDPFNWISVCIPEQYAEYAYNIIIIIKMYLCGISFSILAIYKKRDYYEILAGALIYTFSATMYVIFVQPFFINPMYLFPIVMIGVEKLWNGESARVYVVALACSLINYFYFAYMICIFVLSFCAIKIFLIKRNRNIITLFTMMKKFIGNSIISFAISAFIMLPVCATMIGAGRLSVQYDLPLLYDSNYYKGIISGMVSSFDMLGRDCYIGFGAIIIPCIIALFVNSKEYIITKMAFIVMSIGLCIPYVGHMLNGFSYVANRWVWAYCLCVAYIVSVTIGTFKKMPRIQIFYIMLIDIGYVFIIEVLFKQINMNVIVSALIMLIFCAVMSVSQNFSKKLYSLVTIFAVGLSVIINAYYNFNENNGNRTFDMVEKGTAYNKVINSGGMPLLKDNVINSDQRYDESGIGRVRNASWLYDIGGMDLYISIYNSNIDKFHNDIALLTSPWPMGYAGLNRRTEIDALSGVNYFLVPSGQEFLLPYGYNDKICEKNIDDLSYSLYSIKNKNSIIYMFDDAISYEQYDELTPYEKQQMLMRACVVDEKNANTPIEKIQLKNNVIDFGSEQTEDLIIDNGVIYVNKDNAQVKLKFQSVNEAELYIYFEELNTDENISTYSVSVQGEYNGTAVQGTYNHLYCLTNKSHMYGGKHNWLINLGCCNQPVNEITLTFSQKGVYSLKELKLYKKDFQEISDSINGLNRVSNDIRIADNKLHTDVNLDSNTYLYIAIPYSQGWKATVDGKPVNILKANDAFMALRLEKGNHEIELVYTTPYLIIGMVISILTLLGCCIGMIVLKRKRKNCEIKEDYYKYN